MASRGFSLLRTRLATASRLPPPAFPRPQPVPSSRPKPPSTASRPFSSSPHRGSQRPPNDPRKPPAYDYDATLFDPWAHHRLRTAKPLFSSTKQLLRSPRTHTIVLVSLAAALLFYWANLEVVPVSGRRRFNCYPDSTMRELGEMQFKALVYDMETQGRTFLPAHDPRTRAVARVMQRLVAVAGANSLYHRSEEEGDRWQVYVIADDDPRSANAFVLPGGKVFVHSGLLRLARTDAQLATVLSHEIAHNLARHASERLSQAAGEQLLLGASLMLLAAAAPLVFAGGWFLGGRALSLVFSRPMDRRHESEADYVGLMMMAEACYDPRAAVGFWEGMVRWEKYAEERGAVHPPEWASTHPSSQHRVEKIKEWMPQAMEKFATSDCRGTQGFAQRFRQAMDRGVTLAGAM